MREQDAGWVTHRSDKDPAELCEHPGVVLRVSVRGMVIHGTSTERDAPHIRVDPSSPDGKALGLRNPTFFYQRGAILFVNADRFRPMVQCPPDLFLKLRKLVGF